VPKGIAVGSQAPDLIIETEMNDKVAFHTLYQKQPLVVIFYRGYWCPSCNRYLSNFAQRAIDIEKAGAKIVAITPETYENTQKTKDSTGVDFMVISDLDGSIMQAFDVQFDVTNDYDTMILENLDASIRTSNASKESILPVPATYIINTNGEIVFKQFNPDYNKRASVDEILEYLLSNIN
jgi:peroxiredoxin